MTLIQVTDVQYKVDVKNRVNGDEYQVLVYAPKGLDADALRNEAVNRYNDANRSPELYGHLLSSNWQEIFWHDVISSVAIDAENEHL